MINREFCINIISSTALPWWTPALGGFYGPCDSKNTGVVMAYQKGKSFRYGVMI